VTAATLASLLDESALPDDLIFFDERWTTRDSLRLQARAVADELRRAGIGSGSAVASLVPTSPAALAAMFGVWSAGGVLIPLNVRLTPTELERIQAEARPAAVIEQDGAEVVVRTTAENAAVLDSDVALVLYTSGTTGRPKPVMLTHQAIMSGLDAVLTRLGARAKAAAMPNLIPFSLDLWSGIYNVCFSLRVGAPVVLMPRFDPREFASLVRRFEIKSAVLAPGMLAMLLDDDAVDDLTSLRLVRNATAPLSPRHARRFRERFGVLVLNGYGQSELGGEVVGWNAADAREFADAKLGAVGRPHPGVEVRIVGDGERGLPVGEVGEVCVRSPSVMAGYLTGEEEAAAARFTSDGLLRTGDLGRFDDDGFLWLEGRRTEVINRSGLKVFPTDVEEVLREHPAVGDVAVAGMHDDRLGEVPWAFIVPHDAVPLDAGDLEGWARERLAPYKVPVRFVVVEALPRNDVGKVVRRELQARFR
jgi:acyl-CoA synthetase (AMP-forming)/AMP-acid ligase II